MSVSDTVEDKREEGVPRPEVKEVDEVDEREGFSPDTVEDKGPKVDVIVRR